MRRTTSTFVLLTVALGVAAFTPTALGQTNSATADTDATATATITQMENASVKADIAADPSFVQKNYADNFTGGSSWGNWETKQSILADMNDSKNNKTNSEAISELSVRVYGDTAIATYKSTYDSLYHGDRRARTILSTDTFVRQNGSWKLVASHSSELAK
jgi:ketosteroid isomerase-like protein